MAHDKSDEVAREMYSKLSSDPESPGGSCAFRRHLCGEADLVRLSQPNKRVAAGDVGLVLLALALDSRGGIFFYYFGARRYSYPSPLTRVHFVLSFDRLLGIGRLVHEPAAREHRGVDRRPVLGQPRRGLDH